MSAPTATEARLLDQCGELLQFVAENKTGLPVQVVKDIAAAWDARANSTWGPEVATKFWHAYDDLCSHMRPITLDTYNASRPVYSWLARFGYKSTSSLARKWGLRFLVLLLAILAVSMLLAYISATGGVLKQRIEELTAAGDKSVSSIQTLINARPSEINPATLLTSPALKPETHLWVTQLNENLIQFWPIEDKLYEATNAFVFSVLLEMGEYPLCEQDEKKPAEKHCYPRGRISLPVRANEVLDNMPEFYNFFETEREVRIRTNQVVARLAAINGYLLPALLGMLGACTYVVRTISDQIKNFTFSRASPLQHILRIALGSIVGVVVVTFFNVSTTTPYTLALTTVQLSASAWAFVAGYAMEAVFATFDGIMAKFK